MMEWLTGIGQGFWDVLGEMAPYLLFGFFMAGLLSVLISPEYIERHLGGRGIWASVKAAAFGVPLPLCSCGVIPVAASLRRHGAGKGATTAFLISTPQTGVDSIMVTLALLGGVFAIFRPVAAFLSGIVGGAAVSWLDKDDPAPPKPAACTDACCAPRHGKLRSIFSYGFVTLPRDIGRPLVIGLLLAALITAIVPKGYFSDKVPPGIWQILLLMAAGIPIYVCATASVPLAYALIVAGVSPGAAFAFLMTGPATNAATIATIWKVMGRKTAVIYLATMAVSAVAGGLLLDQFVTGTQVVHHGHAMWMMPQYVQVPAALALLVVLAAALVWRGKVGRAEPSEPTVVLTIRGMTCSHCTETVREALLACPGVDAVEVDLAAGKATVSAQQVDGDALRKAVEEAGYTVAGIERKPDVHKEHEP